MSVSMLGLTPWGTSLGAGVPPPPSMIWMFIGIGILALLGAFVRSPLFKGWLGEAIVNLGLKAFLDKDTCHLVRNVALPCEDGTTQIDHVIVSRFGIFVVETKNMHGWIFGTARDATWTQKFRRSSFQFQNPLRQNHKHAAVMAEATGLPPEAFKSVIMFIGDATLKTGVPPNVAYETQWVLPDFDWPAWAQTPEASELRDSPDVLAQATVKQLAQLLTVIVRQDRFCEGSLAVALESGLVAAICRRAS